MLPPCPTREAVLSFVRNYVAANDCPPSYREIMIGVGSRTVSNIYYHARKLVEMGHLKRTNKGQVTVSRPAPMVH